MRRIALTLESLRRERRTEIPRLAGTHGCRNVSVFGLLATGGSKPGSEIDFLVGLDRDRGLLDPAAFFRTSMISWVST